LRREYFEPDFYQEEQFVPREEQYRPEVEPQGIDRKRREVWRTSREKVIGHGDHQVVKR